MSIWRPLPFAAIGFQSALCAFFFAALGSCSGLPQKSEASPNALRSGPMLADVTSSSVRLWAEAQRSLLCRIQIRRADSRSTWRNATAAGGETWLRLNGSGKRGAIQITGLRPSTQYHYRLVTEVGIVLPDLHGQTFRTAPLDGTAYDFRVAFGSCAGEWGIDPTQPVFVAIDKEQPDLFLWLGDNTYFLVPDKEWQSVDLMEQRWSRSRAIANLQPMLAHTAQYAIWDDHDFGPNDSDKTYILRAESKRLFESFWPNPAAGLHQDDGIFFKFTYGRVEFFMLDTRYNRSPNESPEGPEKTILSDEQWTWLEQGLQTSQADFKVVVSGMQILSNYHRFETWNLFPQQRTRLLDFIRDEKIGGVFFLSGDRHIGEALRQPHQGGYDFFEFTSSPLAAGVGEAQPDVEVSQRISGTLATTENFGMLEFRFPAPSSPDYDLGPVLSFRLHDVYGRPLGRQVVLRLGELQP